MVIYGTYTPTLAGGFGVSRVAPFSDTGDSWAGGFFLLSPVIPATNVVIGSSIYAFVNYNQVFAGRGGTTIDLNIGDIIHLTDGEVPVIGVTLISPVDGVNVNRGEATLFEWNSYPNASSYDIWFDGVGFPEETIDTGGLTNWTLVSNVVGEHRWKIRAKGPFGVSDWSETRSFNIIVPTNVGVIYCDTIPQGARIHVNETSTLLDTPQDLTYAPGVYNIRYALQGYEDGRITVTVIADSLVDATVTLIRSEEPPAILPEVPSEAQYPYTAPINWFSEFDRWYTDIVNWLPQYGTETPDSMVDSAVKVFTGKDPTTNEDVEPDDQDYANLAFLIVGAAGMASSFARAVASRIGGLRVAQQFGGAARMTAAVEGEATIGTVTGNVIRQYVSAIPAKASAVWGAVRADFIKHPVYTLLGGAFLLTQMDATGWFFGLAPEPMHRRLEGIAKGVRGDLIRLNQFVKNENWEAAGTLVPLIRNNLKEGRRMTTTIPVQFWDYFGFTVESAIGMFDTLELSLNAYVDQYPAISVPIEELPEEITTDAFEIVDGDTIITDDTYKIRFLGIDTHEIGTTAGVIERDYLSSLLAGKIVTVRIDPFNQIDQYGRILGVVFADGENIPLKMLARYGEDILPPTKFHDRNKYVDWDENKLVAKSRELPVIPPIAVPMAENVGELNITSSPTHALILIDDVPTGLRTAETLKNIPVGVHPIKLQLEGYVDWEGSAAINAAKTTEIYAKLLKPDEVPKRLSKADIENQFKVGTIDEATARTELTRLEYTVPHIDGFIQTWISELAFRRGEPTPEATAAVFITSSPFYAEIFLDGENTGFITSQTLYVIPDVEHEIRLKYPGYEDWVTMVTVGPGQKKEFRGVLKYITT